MPLSDVEVRVLGALMEKERTTPESYPLSSQSLLTACNQKTSRDPVVNLHLQEVQEAVRRARDRGLLATVQEPGARVPKHRHRMREAMELNRLEAAILSVTMLRGPQTPGELRTRVERYGENVDVPTVVATLQALADRPAPLVTNRGRSPGQSQDRWMHTLGASEERLRPRARGTEDGAMGADDPAGGPARSPEGSAPGGPESRLVRPGDDVQDVPEATLEERLVTLERRVARLEEALAEG